MAKIPTLASLFFEGELNTSDLVKIKKERQSARFRTRTLYGKARDHKCKKCSGPASQWHHIIGTPKENYDHHKVWALCTRCHNKIHRKLELDAARATMAVCVVKGKV